LLVVHERDRDDGQPLHAHLPLDEPLELIGDCRVLTRRLDVLR
jgi:hypothetical protein